MTTTGMDTYDSVEDKVTYDATETEESKWGALRLIGLLALLAAFAGFVYLAYMQGVRNGAVGAPPVVMADKGPYKVEPADPGGRVFDDSEKIIYDRVEGSEPPLADSQLGTAPEEPAQIVASGDDVVEGHEMPLIVAEDASAPIVPPAAPINPTSIEEPDGISAALDEAEMGARPDSPSAQGGPIDAATEVDPAPIATTQPMPTPAPQVAEPPPAQVARAETPTETTPAPSPAAATGGATSGAYVVQIASFRDLPSAQGAWTKLSDKNGDLVSALQPDYQTADVPGKGTYYRLRVGPFDTKDSANALCSQLKARSQDCLVVKS